MSYLSKETQQAFRDSGVKRETVPETWHLKRIEKVEALPVDKGNWRACDVWFRIFLEDGTTMEMSNDFVRNRSDEMAGAYVALQGASWSWFPAEYVATKFVPCAS